MFNLFRKKAEKRKAKAQIAREVLSDMERGHPNTLEAALVLHLAEDNQESLTRFLLAFGSSEIWIRAEGGGRFGDPATIQGADEASYVAVWSSNARCAAGSEEWKSIGKPLALSALELVFDLNSSAGIVLNVTEPYLQWTFTPQHVANLRTLFERSYNFNEGGVYVVRAKGAFRAAKLLKADVGGVHIRVYANAWTARPANIDLGTLTLAKTNGASSQAYGHLPMTRSSFLSMGPKLAAQADTLEGELEGYRLWEEAQGGYFSNTLIFSPQNPGGAV